MGDDWVSYEYQIRYRTRLVPDEKATQQQAQGPAQQPYVMREDESMSQGEGFAFIMTACALAVLMHLQNAYNLNWWPFNGKTKNASQFVQKWPDYANERAREFAVYALRDVPPNKRLEVLTQIDADNNKVITESELVDYMRRH